jgi:hypothetical protein
MGGCATGVIAVGGLAIGLFSIGGLGLGLLLAFGGIALAPLGISYGGFALGLLAVGGFACGVVASGGFAMGLWVPGGGMIMRYFTPETVPQFLILFDNFLSFRDEASKSVWVRSNVVVNVFFYSLLTIGLAANAIFLGRENRRFREADPRILE